MKPLRYTAYAVLLLTALACAALPSTDGMKPTQAQAAGNGQQKVWVITFNASETTSPGSAGQGSLQNDVDEIAQAYFQGDSRVGGVTISQAISWATLQDDIIANFGASDKDDICVYYQAGHGGQQADQNNEMGETDALDGKIQVDTDRVRDDVFDNPFQTVKASGKCGAGLVILLSACKSGEIIVGAADFNNIVAPDVIITSTTETQACMYKEVGGHGHSLFGGRGFLVGISDTNSDGSPEAVANANNTVTAAELYNYIVANDNDPGADPQAKNGASNLPVFVANINLATHGTAVNAIGQGNKCSADELTPKESAARLC